MDQEENKKIKISLIFVIIVLLFIILIVSIVNISLGKTKIPKLIASEDDRALKGSIISSDGFTISRSKKLYKATVDTRNIDPDKKELFIKIFSIYSGIDIQTIKKRVNSHFGYVVLTYNLDSKSAKYVKQLIYKLYRYRVFKPYVNEHGVSFFHGLNVVESGENREFPLQDTLTPIIGYIKKVEVQRYTDTIGVYGLEMFYKDSLIGSQNAKIKGRRDVLSTIILDKDSEIKHRIDGYNIITSISIKLQKSIEQILDQYKQELKAQEIIAAVMDSKSGNIIAIASTNRFNPNRIKTNKNLSSSAIKYTFEPGSVMKPITLALLLKSKKVTDINEIIYTHNGKYKIGNKIITDEHPYEYLSVEDIIVKSSNIGIAKLAQRLDVISFYQGLRDFGFSKKSGIDLPYELRGSIPNIHKLKSQIFKATTSYGYGIRANFFQLLSAYNIFNNSGKFIKPTIAEFIVSKGGLKQKLYNKTQTQIISKTDSDIIKNILIKTVIKGTAQAAKSNGLIIGGKTGTAHIVKKGEYADIYNSSFFGFANDNIKRYTIGVTVIEIPKENYNHFASKSAVPIFKNIVDILVDKSFLKPYPL